MHIKYAICAHRCSGSEFRDARVFCHMLLDAQKKLHMLTRSGNRAPTSGAGPLYPTYIIPHRAQFVNRQIAQKFSPSKFWMGSSSNCTNGNGVGLFYNDFDLCGRLSEQKSVVANVFTEAHFLEPCLGLILNSQRIIF